MVRLLARIPTGEIIAAQISATVKAQVTARVNAQITAMLKNALNFERSLASSEFPPCHAASATMTDQGTRKRRHRQH